ncbi:site-specific integrase [Flavobacterium sp. Sr18]|uniref:site-specific integrase n=1 Tax=Flavobacterium sp. Sr18 TaxID=935222 RepID=UPI0013E43F69|nr:site-specific integrase [Flavobacterium sp. Sr18]QIH39731.1 site-specific integrase [Flavobacterium sp. Sr18]
MATVHFLYRSVRSKAKLEVRLQHTHKTFENITNYIWTAKTQIEVTENFWTKQRKVKSKGNIDISNEQTRVNNLCNALDNFILECFNTTTPEAITKNWLQTQIDHYYSPPIEKLLEIIPVNLIDYFDYYIKHKENRPTDVLIRKIIVVRRKLERLEKYRKKQILIKDINKQFKNEFQNYCDNEKYSRLTTQRDFAEIKTICLDARSKGIETSLELDKLSFKREKATNIYLTIDELQKIENIEKSKLADYLENARDWLLISCFTAQRISDFMRFTADMIRIEDGQNFIEFTQVKTDKIMTVPLHPKVIEILSKRNGNFPKAISSQKYNDYIKLVCEIAELTQEVYGSKLTETAPESGIFRKETKMFRKCDLASSHIGRRSFATNFYTKIPTTLLKNITGHTTEAMLLNYLGKSNKDLAKETHKYF